MCHLLKTSKLDMSCSFPICRYERLLRRARTEDLSDLAAHRCIYQTGTDIFGRPIVIFVARNFPASIIDLDKVRITSLYCQYLYQYNSNE